MYRLCFLLLPLLVVSQVYAGGDPIKIKEVVVSATKVEEPVEETTSDVIVIKEEDIKEMNVEFVPDVLKRVSELNLVQSGGVGKKADVILRGGSSEHTLVMIDGIKVKSTTLGSFDFSGINVHDIERIEIVKGPQSTIYGSEAMAGVINIITKKGKGKPKVAVSFESGSFGTYNPSATVSGGDKKLDYRLTGTYFYTDGISAAKNGEERDGYKNAALSGKFGFRPAEKLELELSGKYYYDRSELDDRGDDLNYTRHGNHYILSGKGKFYLSDIWEQILTYSNVKDSLKDRDTDTPSNNADIITGIETIDWQHNFYFTNNYTLIAGFENRLEKGENIGNFSKKVYNNALYLHNKLSLFEGLLHLNGGIRYDDHETFGNKYTYRLGAVSYIKSAGIKIMANYGTGFRAPSFNELFWPADRFGVGNPNLQPEETDSWEAGIEKGLFNETVVLTATYFNQRYDDLIANWPPVNLGNAEVKGFEAGVSTEITDDLMVRSAYTYLDTDDGTGQRLTRRPKDKINISAEYSAGPVTMLAGYVIVSEVFDSTAGRNLASYSLVNLSGSYKLTKHVKLFARIDNLLNEDYETAGGFNSPGFSAFGGVKLGI